MADNPDSAIERGVSTPLCTPTSHRCTALALAFFDILATGEIGPLTLAAVAACEAERTTDV